MVIQNAIIYTEDCVFKKGSLLIRDNKFVSVDLCDSDNLHDVNYAYETDVIDATGLYAIPGLIDLHFHACNGRDFCEGTLDALSDIARYEAGNGITSICPATMSLDTASLNIICKTASEFIPAVNEASLVGINLEGPFLSHEKRGAQNLNYLMLPDVSLVKQLNTASGGMIKLVSLAPELPGAMEFINALKDDFVISAAHTMADFETAKQAFAHGIMHVTHLYNAMQPFSHRAPGLLGAAYDNKKCTVELICDNIHVAPTVVRMTFDLYGNDRIILISDTMMAAGLSDGMYTLGEQTVQVHGNLATLSDGTIAGSVTNLFSCMQNAIKMGISPESVIKCATENPAKLLGIYEKVGSITSGKTADLLLLNPDLSLHSVFLRGKQISIN